MPMQAATALLKCHTQGISAAVRHRSVAQAVTTACCLRRDDDGKRSGAWVTLATLAALGGLTIASQQDEVRDHVLHAL